MRLDYRFRSILTIISPKLNTLVVYHIKKKRKMNWKNPQTFVEKLLKLKVTNYNYNPLVKQCADKYAVRQYVQSKGFGNMLNQLITTYDSVAGIEWDKLPERFAMKINTGSGHNIICHDYARFDREKAIIKLEKWMKSKPWLGYAEMQYKDVPIKILVEKYLEGKDGVFPEDYKIYCFNGEPKAVLFISGRYSKEERGGFFDLNWNYIGNNKSTYINFTEENMPAKPESLEEMIEAAKNLSEGFPFVRVDFYDVDGKPFFGEMTFTPAGAFDVNEIDIDGVSMGDMLEI